MGINNGSTPYQAGKKAPRSPFRDLMLDTFGVLLTIEQRLLYAMPLYSIFRPKPSAVIKCSLDRVKDQLLHSLHRVLVSADVTTAMRLWTTLDQFAPLSANANR